jgi:hypothetical protein
MNNSNMIYETLKELIDNQRKQDLYHDIHDDQKLTDYQITKRKEPSRIYLDEKDNQIKEIPLRLDSSASALINRTVYNYKNPLKLIHDSIFGSLQL